MRFLNLLLTLLALSVGAVAQERIGPVFDEREYELGKRAGREYQEHLERSGLNAGKLLESWRSRGSLREKRDGASPLSAMWEFIGPRNQAGRMTGLAVARGDSNLWYASADGGGVWKTITAGTTWIPLTDTMPSLRMSTITVSPHDDELVIAGTHEGMLYRSSDGGASWDIIPLENGGYVHEIHFHPGNAEKVLACSNNGLFASSDAGRTWTLQNEERVYSIAWNPIDPSIIFYSAPGSVWRSTDGGERWTRVFQEQIGGAIIVRLCASFPDVLYTSVVEKQSLYKSTNGGETWTILPSQPMRDSYLRGFDVLEVDPSDPEILFTGTTSLFRSIDGGRSWEAGDTVNKDLHVDQYAFVFPPNMPGSMLCANDGGIYKTTDYAAFRIPWEMRNRDLVTLQIYNCAIHPHTDDTVIVGCQDNGYDKFSGDEYDWLVVGGDGFCTIYDREQPAYFYHEYVNHNLHRSDDGFTWWSRKVMNGLPTDNSPDGFYTGFSQPDRSDWYGQAITISPADPKVLYIGSNRLYKTVNRAESWNRVSNMEFGMEGWDFITNIAVAPSRPSLLYIGTQGGKLYRVLDENSTPTITDISDPESANVRIRGISVSSSNPDEVYVVGDGGWWNRGVFMSTNGGSTWKLKNKGLPQGSVNRIIHDPDSAGTLYCGTSFGFYYTRDGGEQWYPFPDFPNVEVWDIVMKKETRTLLVGTYGRGAIRARGFVPPAAPVISGIDLADATTNGSSMRVISHPGGGATVRLAIERGDDVAVAIYDYLGRRMAMLHDGAIASGEHEFSITDALNLAPGHYLIVAQGKHVRASAWGARF